MMILSIDSSDNWNFRGFWAQFPTDSLIYIDRRNIIYGLVIFYIIQNIIKFDLRCHSNNASIIYVNLMSLIESYAETKSI